ncbi:hypothetical protein [Prosthecobacter fluviatilis]|uniref:Uncharacterized protein n=1 Tax=Prosthecobacter fluviatilis TaxID=445931 RepID=A0ABW0KUJ3_9BACT
MRELAWHERQFVALVVGGVPAGIAGFFLGLWGNGIGGRVLDLSTVLLRGGYCSVFPVLLACLMPRSWIPPAMTYLIGFSLGFRSSDGFAMLADIIVAPVHWLEGRHTMMRPPPLHPDLPWILGLALWLAGLASLLRRSRRFVAMLRRFEIRYD